MKVIVNRELCVGHGLCEAVAQNIFTVGDDGIAELLLAEIPDDQAALVAEAVAACPSQALRADTQSNQDR